MQLWRKVCISARIIKTEVHPFRISVCNPLSVSTVLCKKIAGMRGEIGEIMRKLRVVKNISQEHIAEEVGVDPASLSRYERGESQPKFETVLKLADLYKMTIDEFINYGNPDFLVEDPKDVYRKKWSVPITITLDGTNETLDFWIKRLPEINRGLSGTYFGS